MAHEAMDLSPITLPLVENKCIPKSELDKKNPCLRTVKALQGLLCHRVRGMFLENNFVKK